MPGALADVAGGRGPGLGRRVRRPSSCLGDHQPARIRAGLGARHGANRSARASPGSAIARALLRRAAPARPDRTIYRLTGLTVDPMFSASKARWLLGHIPDGLRRAQAGDICLGTVDAWLLWNLTGGAVHACDVTNASRTQLFNLQTLAWDESCWPSLRFPAPALPEVKMSGAPYGETVKCPGFPPACRLAP